MGSRAAKLDELTKGAGVGHTEGERGTDPCTPRRKDKAGEEATREKEGGRGGAGVMEDKTQTFREETAREQSALKFNQG